MGANLARNLARNGYTVALHNRSVEKTDTLLAKHGDEGDFIRTETLQELVDSLVNTDPTAEREDAQCHHERPKVSFRTVAERMAAIRLTGAFAHAYQ